MEKKKSNPNVDTGDQKVRVKMAAVCPDLYNNCQWGAPHPSKLPTDLFLVFFFGEKQKAAMEHIIEH